MRTGKKTIWTLMLAMFVVMLSFGSAWADVNVITDPAVDVNGRPIGNNGDNTGGLTTPATNVYFVQPDATASPSKIIVAIDIYTTGATYTDGDEITPAVTSNNATDGTWRPGWATTTAPKADSSGQLASSTSPVTLLLTRDAGDAFDALGEDVVVELKDGASNPATQTLTIKVTPVPIPFGKIQDVVLTHGFTYTGNAASITGLASVSGITFNWTTVSFTKDSANATTANLIAEDLMKGDSAGNVGITVNHTTNTANFTLTGTSTRKIDSTSYYVYAKNFTIDETGGAVGVLVAGVTEDANNLVAQVNIEIADPYIKLSQNKIGFVVGGPFPSTPLTIGVDYFAVDGYASVHSLLVSSPDMTGGWANSKTLNGLVITTDNTGGTAVPLTGLINFATAPNNIASATTYTVQSTLVGAAGPKLTDELKVTIVSLDRAIEPTPTITDPTTGSNMQLQKGKQSVITFTSPVSLDMTSIKVNNPDGTSGDIKMYSGSDTPPTTGNYAFVSKNSDGETIIDIYLTPTQDGEYGFDFGYTYNGSAAQKQAITGVGRRTYYSSSGSSSSCGMGFGIAGILALAGVALIRRRESY